MRNFNIHSQLWDGDEKFFEDCEFDVVKQPFKGTCVAATLSSITKKSPNYFLGKINTQNPVTWSKALEEEFGLKLQYCPTDIRKVKYYMNELIELDDLFLVSYYVTENPSNLLNPPDEDGWLSKSHVVLMHQNKIIDSKLEKPVLAKKHIANEMHTKRIFRVVKC